MAFFGQDALALFSLLINGMLVLAWAPVALLCDIALLVLERVLCIPPPVSTVLAFLAGHAMLAYAAASQVSVEGSAAAAAAGLFSRGSVPVICSTHVELSHSLTSALVCLSQGILITALSGLVLMSRILAISLGLAIQAPLSFGFILLTVLGIWGRASA